MVRTTIACAWCRRSKIKCIHQGEPPCRNCLRNGRTSQGDCILSGPNIHAIRRKRYRTPTLSHKPTTVDTTHEEGDIGADNTTCASNAVSAIDPDGRVINTLRNTSRTDVLQAASKFHQTFPELSFLHLATFDVDSQETSSLLLKAAMMALCSTHQDETARYVKTALSGLFLEPPKLVTIQTLLLLAMYEWGDGRGYDAWMTTGVAIRMMQSLETMRGPTRPSELEQEIYNRTFWSCFIMDRLVLCGKGQPFTLPLDQMRIHLPIGDQDFAFGQSSNPRIYIGNIHGDMYNTIEYSYSILVRGFDIWARILKWIINGGRRQPGMTLLANCPWTPGSPWKDLYDELDDWRQHQHQRMKYPGVQIAGHVSLGHGEQFAFINLVYYISILFLSREYIPFLPKPESIPVGPVDPPLLESAAPEGWWVERADQLFNSSAQITNLLQELDDLNTSLLTPFSGFCAFSAAIMNAYVSSFPRMNYGKCIHFSTKLLEVNIQWLSRFKEIWKMGNGWFKTTLHARNLYIKASRDHQRFQGKTRADFEALEASIHDSSGVSPIHEDDTRMAEVESHEREIDTSHAAEAALGLQQLSHSHNIPEQSLQPLEDMYFPHEISIFNQWNQVWPLWGEQQFGPLASGGFNLDYNIDIPGL
ncbi:uncharacterized protein BDZ99DRAFT_73562 [Mytilinidion resinicola]|uniref:Zn(2)-C6 fungal-type domain-containing protein n=1 Tax=Mytilinidion resinicola TaxID=574789 RepID=A0A6A6YHR3_9PEZI|nr:uncharacterized protein BDZ99DRAFT_73562 [Mytilinidion resinicola]KAF2808118.1 hypothetical protein BDZ99DRAFT_73562 [Mytilinidion resinicola]